MIYRGSPCFNHPFGGGLSHRVSTILLVVQDFTTIHDLCPSFKGCWAKTLIFQRQYAQHHGPAGKIGGPRLFQVLVPRKKTLPSGVIQRGKLEDPLQIVVSMGKYGKITDKMSNCPLPCLIPGAYTLMSSVMGNGHLYPLVDVHITIYGKSRCLMGKLTISMAMLNSYTKLPELQLGNFPQVDVKGPESTCFNMLKL